MIAWDRGGAICMYTSRQNYKTPLQKIRFLQIFHIYFKKKTVKNSSNIQQLNQFAEEEVANVPQD